MKNLTTEQQEELQQLFLILDESNLPLTLQTKAQIGYWRIELKPKRVRRNPVESA